MRYIKDFLILENIQKAKQLLSKINIDSDTSSEFKQIRQMLSGHDGYVYWFTEQFFVKKQNFNELLNVWNTIKDNKGLISQFKKNITNLNTIEEFWDEFLSVQKLQRIKTIYNEFPSTQKKLINLNSEEDTNILDSLSQNKGKDVILKKIALYKTKEQLFAAINRLVNYEVDDEFGKLLRRINHLGSDIIFQNESESIIICKVNYKQIKELGADTAWCIVRSESTFDGYCNINLIGSQYIIFLTNETGPMRKIGVTTNINGYYTAHDINDRHIPKNDLVFLLEDRGVNIGLLYPTKDNIKFSMFGRIGTKVLTEFGFTKAEILKHKQIFRNDDLEIFTEKEIEVNKLLDKTELSYQSLKSFSKEVIIEKNLINRVPHHINLQYLSELGFTLSEVKDLIKNKRYHVEGDFDKSLFTLVTSIRPGGRSTIQQKFIKLFDDLWRTHRDNKTYAQRVILNFANLTPSDITVDRLDSILERDFFRDRTWDRIKYYITFGYKINDIYKVVINNNPSFKFISELLANSDLKTIPGLEDLLISDFTRKLDDRYGFDMNYIQLTEIKTNLRDNYIDLYNLLYDRCRKNVITNPFYLRVRDRNSSSNSNKDTIRNVNFFAITAAELPFERVGSILDGMGYDWNETLSFFDKMGYQYSGKQGFDVISGIVSRNESEIDKLEKFIKHGIYVDECYDLLVEFLNKNQQPLSSYQKDSLKKLLDGSKKYKNLWETQEKKDRINYVLLTTLSSSKYWSGQRGGDKLEPQAWYDKIFEELSQIDLNNCGFSEVYRIAIGAIIMLAKIGKHKDFEKIKFNFLSSKGDWTYSSSGRNSFTDLCKVIANKNITNWDYTWRIYLDPKQRKSIYNWLVKYIEKNKKREEVSDYHVATNMIICYYLYDKDKLRSAIDLIKKTRSNIVQHYYGQSKPRVSTNRLMGVKYLLGYLAEMGKWEDFRKYLEEFAELKMGKDEIRSIRSTLRWFLHFSKSPEAEDKEIHTSRQSDINSKIAQQIVDEIFPVMKKESRILKWNEL